MTERTWATLADGTPLVTAQRRGKGLVVLFHITADTRWSDLPLSGTFVEMLKRIVSFAGSVGRRWQRRKRPRARARCCRRPAFSTVSARSGPPPATARPVPADFGGRATFDHPPGFYGPPEGLLAVNALAPADRLAPLDVAALNARREAYRMSEPEDLRGPILLAALALLALDALVVFLLAGGIGQLVRRRRPAAAALAVAIFAATLAAMPQASAQSPAPPRQSQRSRARRASDEPAVKSTLETRLAYVVTGDAEVDRISKAGLQGLTLFLAQRTALEAGEPIGLDPAPRRACLLSADLLADRAERAQADARGARAYRRLHEARRHRPVRHPRRGRGACRPGRREPRSGHAGAAHHSLLARHSRARAGAGATTC